MIRIDIGWNNVLNEELIRYSIRSTATITHTSTEI